MVVGFMRGRWGAPLGWLGSFRYVGLIRVRPTFRWVHSGSLDCFGCALGVIRFIKVSLFHSGVRSMHSGSFG